MRFTTVVGAAALIGFAALAVSMSQRGDAAFPGTNGKIAYAYGDAYMTSIWSANSDGSAPVKLTNGTGDFDPTYSANGARIAFDREGGVEAMNADGSGLAQLVPGTHSSSSHEEWQEHYKDPRSSKEIPIVKIDEVTESWNEFFSPAFSPDGSQLAVAENNGKRIDTSICAVKSMGEKECIGYNEPDSYFNYEDECQGCISHIVTVSSTTGGRTGEVTPPSPTTEDSEPTYSASGKLAFARMGPLGTAIFIVNSPGATPTQLTVGPNDYSPNFSPDGSRLVFNHGRDEFGLVSVSGGPVTILSVPLPPGATQQTVSTPTFSPDGSKIAFQRYAYGKVGKVSSGIFTMGIDGSGLAPVVEGAYTPTWQPIPLPPPPPPVPASVKGKKGKIKLDKKGEASAGSVVCGSSACSLKVVSSVLKVGKKKYRVKVKLAPALSPLAKSEIGVRLGGKALAALKMAGKGALTIVIQVGDASGQRPVTLKSTLTAAKAKGKGAGKKKH